jgi:S1-C subfamily serine protease
MERIILRHLKGSKASQLEEFPLAQAKEITIGRDPASSVRFDNDRDDLVGRQHARLQQDPSDPYRFTVTDLNSRNGTYLNKLRVVGQMPLNPGDIVQLGAGGPELQFDIDPLPPHLMKTTRLAGVGSASAAPVLPETRVGDAPMAAPASDAALRPGIGKATVQRLISETKSETRRNMMIGAAAALVLVSGGAALMVRQSRSNTDALKGQVALQGAQVATKIDSLQKITKGIDDKTQALTPTQIATANTPAVVKIEISWKLVYRQTGQQVWHMYVPNRIKDNAGHLHPIIDDGRQRIPAYVVVGDQKLEPALTVDEREGGLPIGSTTGGSGFVVTNDGFILTNRHVAATWRTIYGFDQSASRGVIVTPDGKIVMEGGAPVIVNEPPNNWVPSETKQAGPKQLVANGVAREDPFQPRLEYLYVFFPNNTTPVEATLQRTSDRHDVALIKVAVPQSLPKVELFDNYDKIQPGDAAIVMGYPAIASYTVSVIKSRDMFNRETDVRVVPDPTVSVGNVGKVVRGMDFATNGQDFKVSGSGDTYQLTINSTGGGNSGGPMFDDHGRVVGIFFAGRRMDAQITFAVPIRYGLELMTVTPNVR